MVALMEADLHRPISFHRPDRAERIAPGPDERGLALFMEHRAPGEKCGTNNNQSKGGSFVHARDAVQIAHRFQERIVSASLLTHPQV